MQVAANPQVGGSNMSLGSSTQSSADEPSLNQHDSPNPSSDGLRLGEHLPNAPSPDGGKLSLKKIALTAVAVSVVVLLFSACSVFALYFLWHGPGMMPWDSYRWHDDPQSNIVLIGESDSAAIDFIVGEYKVTEVQYIFDNQEFDSDYEGHEWILQRYVLNSDSSFERIFPDSFVEKGIFTVEKISDDELAARGDRGISRFFDERSEAETYRMIFSIEEGPRDFHEEIIVSYAGDEDIAFYFPEFGDIEMLIRTR